MKGQEYRKFRPLKIFALFLAVVALILTIVSLTASKWISMTLYDKETKSFGLFWDCIALRTDLELCISVDWLNACAALVILSLIADVAMLVCGTLGLCKSQRRLYVTAGILCLVSILFLIICLIIYPVKFKEEVDASTDYVAAIREFHLDWTYGLTWGVVCFHIGAAVFFFIRVEDEHPVAKPDVPMHHYDNPVMSPWPTAPPSHMV